MNFNALEAVLKNEPPYRLKQAKRFIFQELGESWLKASSLPLALRERLEKDCPLKIPAKFFVSGDKKTVKALILLKDGLKIETVLLCHQDGRNTICVSSQVGCPLGCLFCATGKMGFKRNLTASEIVQQVLFFARYLKKEGRKVTNVVFMGMGEPFLNYENVMGAIQILNDKEGFNLGARHFSISTIGISEGIKKLAKQNLQVNLAISLHAPDDELRAKIIPLNKKYPIKKIFPVVNDYLQKTHRRVMIEYLMIKNFNDSPDHAWQLVKLLQSFKKPLYFVNLISYNPTGIFQISPPSKIKQFKKILEKAGITVTQRYRFGREIKAGCGQLVVRTQSQHQEDHGFTRG